MVSPFSLLTKAAALGLKGVCVHFFIKMCEDIFFFSFFEPHHGILNHVFRLEIVKSSVQLFYKL